MKKKILPAAGIIIVTLILIAINELTELTFIKDYALIFIVTGMLFGVWLSKISGKPEDQK
jgi:hypothetical protein